ncbi:MAG TPA: FliA/WhiG family RNA polymerase sigma factor [Candidatus Mediterraneibacter pullistercoris]|nr:FliA/WhiG family RNA polymerase sigma factor [Candidatus Mediterraneibacter pullistercoris]
MSSHENQFTDKTNEELLEEYSRTKDLAVKQELVSRYMYVIKTIAIQMRDVYLSFTQVEDIIQEGVIVLMNLLDKYDSSKNAKFETYLSRRMRGLVIDLARKQEWGSRNVRKSMKQIENAIAELTIRDGKTPDSKDVAKHLNMPYDKYQEVIGKNSLLSIISLDMVLEESQEKNHAPQAPAAGPELQPEETYLKKELSEVLEQGISQLKEKEKIIISLYYVEELNMREIAEIMEVSEPRISQLHAGAIRKLTEYIENEFQISIKKG